MPLPPEVVGELGRCTTRLQKALSCVEEQIGRVRSELWTASVQAQLLQQLTAEECVLLCPHLDELDAAALQGERDRLVAQRDVLVKAIRLLEARLG